MLSPRSDSGNVVKSTLPDIVEDANVSQRSQSLLEGDKICQIEFSTEKNSAIGSQAKLSLAPEFNRKDRVEKKQGFLPRELLQFLDLKHDFIESFMEN